jgi:hypothetical protein
VIDRKYNFNTQYINKLIKNNEFTTKKKICERLEITENALTLKISQRTLIYINEGIEIADELHMDILDVFCPTEQMLFDLYYKDNVIENLYTKKSYGEFNLHPKYLKKILANNGIKINDLCDLWGLKIVSIYEKLRGDTKITVKEGILLSLFLTVPVNDLFCPSEDTIILTLAKDFQKSLEKSNKPTKYIIDKTMLAGFDINNMNVNTQYLKDLLYLIGKKPKDLSYVIGLSVPHVYNKINKKLPMDFDEALNISVFLNKPMKEIFNPTKKDIIDTSNQVKTLKTKLAKEKRDKWLQEYKEKKKKKKNNKKKKINTKP